VSEVINNEVVIDEVAVAAETERLLKVAAERNGTTYEAVKEHYEAAAREQALKAVQNAAAENGLFERLYKAERQQRQVAEQQLEAIRTQGVKHNSPAGGPPVSAEQAKARAGAHQWLHKMTDAQKIAALGVDPSTVNPKEAAKLFGRGADTKLATDLHKADPAKYRVLREVAIALGSYGA
jgi:hypothetical protein